MKILIVDDEPIVRICMRTIIPWEDFDYQIVGEATDGLEALRLVKQYNPDIVLVDIVMPDMNGLEFIREVHKILPTCKSIILSCKDDVDYYREAISLGVCEYIQKSAISSEEILNIVNKVSDEIRKERIFENSTDNAAIYINNDVILTEFFNMILQGQITDTNIIKRKLILYNLDSLLSPFFVLAIPFVNGDQTNIASIINLCQEILDDVSSGYIFRGDNQRIVIIFSSPEEGDEVNLLEYFCDRIQNTIEQLFDIRLTIGVSSKLIGPEKIFSGYQMAVENLKNVFFRGEGVVLFTAPDREQSEIVPSLILEEKSKIIACKSLGDIRKNYHRISRISDALMNTEYIKPKKVRAIYLDILYHLIEILRKDDIDIKIDIDRTFNPIDYIERPLTIQALRDQMIVLFEKIFTVYDSKYQNNKTRLISNINQYIENHITEKILLEDISRHVNFSATYVSRIYKQETGRNIKEHIISMKIEKAKEMLSHQTSLSTIAEALDFSSTSHLIKTFKALTGETPKKFISS